MVEEHGARRLNPHYIGYSDRTEQPTQFFISIGLRGTYGHHVLSFCPLNCNIGGAVRSGKEEMKDIVASLKPVRRRACEMMISATKL